ncbi:MAG: hypothetical protein Q9219_000733 [cf. Caloplaca sp. 3 TL-2023]
MNQDKVSDTPKQRATSATKESKVTKTPKTSPKKRGTNGDDEDASPKKKQRAPAKAKAKATEPESDGEDANEGEKTPVPSNGVKVKSESSAEGDIESPMTPKRGKRAQGNQSKAPSTPKTPKNKAPTKEKPDAINTKGTPRKRSAADKVADKISLPTTWAEAGDADKTLVEMKNAGKTWSEIREMWLEKTGQEVATSTLPNRFKRLQIVMMQLEEHEKSLLLATKEEVEANWKNSKWALIARKMEEKGSKYPAEFLQKEFKKLDVASSANQNNTTAGDALFEAAKKAVADAEDTADEE